MVLIPRAFPLKEGERLKKLVFLRLVLSTLVVGAAIMILHLYDGNVPVAVLYSLLGVTYLSTGCAYAAFRGGMHLKPVVGCLIAVDLAVLTAICHFSGGASSYFTVLYVLPVLIGGEFFHIAGGLSTALLATTIYFVYSLLESKGYVGAASAASDPFKTGSDMYGPLLRGYLHMVLFVVAGMLSGYVSRHIQFKGEALADKEKEIRRIQLNNEFILNNMSSGLVVTDLCGTIISINPAAVSILGLDGGMNYKGLPFTEVMPDLGLLMDELNEALETGAPKKRHEIAIAMPDRGLLQLGLSISFLRDEAGETRGLIAVFQDLSEVIEMREKMRRSDRLAAVGELSAAIAHEIRAPLASICGSVEMLKGELDLSGDNEELMNLVIKESDRLDGIISDFLEFARLRRPALEPVDIEKCLTETVMLLRHGPNISHKTTISVESHINGRKIKADDEQIRQVFLNIGLNACEVIKKSGALEITIDPVVTRLCESGEPEECVQIEFSNDGPPIPAEAISHVFEPFFTTKEGGTGLGLATAARIVEGHSGIIKVKSGAGERTVFSVILPVSARTIEEQSFDNEFCNV